jgi:hypothetical protein
MLFPQLHALVRRACLRLGGESAHEIRLIKLVSLMWKQREPLKERGSDLNI